MKVILNGWTELRAVWNKGAHGVVEAVRDIEAKLPFPLLGFDCDNGSGVFKSSSVALLCPAQRARALHSLAALSQESDNACVEQKSPVCDKMPAIH
jgi:hypothetical protein